MAFLVTMTYVVLVRMSHVPSAGECYVIAYVFTMAIEKVREVGVDRLTSCYIRLREGGHSFTWH